MIPCTAGRLRRMAERDTDPRAGRGRLRDRVLPFPLGPAAGHEQVAPGDDDGAAATPAPGSEAKRAGRAERDDGDHRLDDRLVDAVAVRGHAVAAVAVEVQAAGGK